MSNRTPTLESLFEAAAELKSADQRAAYLEQACGKDTELRRQIERLLRSDEKAGDFLENPPAELGDAVANADSHEEQADLCKVGLASAVGNENLLVIGTANQSILKSFENTLDLPRVILREPKNEPGSRIQRLNSPDMPDVDANRRYQMQGEIARGGMGAIIKARDTDLGRDLAIKVLLDEHKSRPEVIQRFLEEAQIGGQLQHPGIVPIYELGQFDDERPFFSMKLVKGETLSKVLADREDSAKDRGKLIGIFEQICQTMAYAHSRGVIHRDLKPANIMIGAFGEVQVMDWGLAKVLQVGGVADEKNDRDTQHDKSIIQTLRSMGSDTPASLGSAGSETQMGSVIGTPAYMPPEQALGEIDRLNERSDVFGLGAILCQILTGKPPYVGDDSTEIFRLASRGKLDDCFARLDACGADADLIQITKACLALEPEDRPRDAGILTEQVSGYLESVETKLRETDLERAAQTATAIEERKRARVTMALAASIIFTLIMAGGGWMWMGSQQAQRRSNATINIKEKLAEVRILAANIESELTTDSQQLPDAEKVDRWFAEFDQAVVDTRQACESAKKENVDQELLDSSSNRLSKWLDQTKPARRWFVFQKSLNQIRLDQSDAITNSTPDDTHVLDTRSGLFMFSFGSTAQEYEQAFRNAGLDLNDPQVAETIRNSPIREDVLGALDIWARILTTETSNSGADTITRDRLMDVADRADPSEGSKSLRSDLRIGNSEKLVARATIPEATQQSAALIVWLSAALRENGEFETAIGLLETGLLKRPGDFWLNYELARCFIEDGDFENAISYARTTLAMRPKSRGARCMLGRALILGEDYPQAVSVLRIAAAEYPTDAAISLHLAYSLEKSEDSVGAIAVCENGLKYNPEDAFLYMRLGLIFGLSREPDKAADMYRSAIKFSPEFVMAKNHLAWTLFDQGKMDEGMAVIRECIFNHPKDIDAIDSLGNMLRRQGKTEKAKIQFEKCIEVGPDSAIGHVALGYIALKEGNLKDAIAHYKTGTEVDKKYLSAFTGLGTAMAKKALTDQRESDDDFSVLDEAFAVYSKGIKNDPTQLRAYYGFGAALAGQKEYEAAIAQYRKCIKIDPKYANAYLNLGVNLAMQGKNDEALAMYRKCNELDPKNKYASYNIGLQYIRRGEIKKAVALMRMCIDSNPSYGPGYDLLAYALHFSANPSKEDLRESIQLAQRACQLYERFSRNHANSLQNLGIAYYRAKQWPEALEALHQSIADNDEFDEPTNWLFIAMCHWQQKDEIKARKLYQKSVKWLNKNEPVEGSWSWFFQKRHFAEAAELFGEAPETPAKPDKTPSADQDPGPEKTPPASGAQDQSPDPQDQTTDSDNSKTNRS